MKDKNVMGLVFLKLKNLINYKFSDIGDVSVVKRALTPRASIDSLLVDR